MIRSEELFMIINDIDDDIIDEAKLKADTPVQMKPEPRSPIKGIVALAACIAVLAVGVFAIVKFKLNNTPDPVDSDSSEISSSYDDDYSIDEDLTDPHPEIELTFTEEDRELQAMLRELIANVNEIDGMFSNLSTSGKAYTFKFDQYNIRDYYLIPQDQQTANGLFIIPQSYDEMEQLLSGYLSPIAVEFYMFEVDRGTMTENSDGTFDVKTTSGIIPTFIEINGRMYVCSPNSEDYGTGVDCETARVISRSDKSIRFSYKGYEYDKPSGTINFPLREGIAVLENGTPKLHFFSYYGFLSEFPVEYTEQDLELQEMFKAMAPGYDLAGLFAATRGGEGDQYIFFLPGKSGGRYFYDISSPELDNKYPQSISELEETLLKYFTQEVVDHYMSGVCKGTMTANADGTYNVTLDKDIEDPVLVEINGRIFQSESVASGRGGPWYSTAKVIEQTDDTMFCSCTWSGMGGYHTEITRFKYERGGWKWDLFYYSDDEPEAPDETATEYTDSDRALQALLEKLITSANEVHSIFSAREPNGEAYLIRNNYPPYYGTDTYYLVSDDMKTKPGGLYSFPQSIDEMRTLLSGYFTEDSVNRYIEENTDRCILDVRNGTTLDVKRTSEYEFKPFLEIDGSLYYKPKSIYDEDTIDLKFDTIKVLRRNKNVIEFEYDIELSDGDIISGSDGVIVYENGSWKLSYNFGFRTAVPTEFTDEDLELQAILKSLAPGIEAADWFVCCKSSPYDTDVFEFLLPDHRSAEEYVLLPQGTLSSNSSIKIPHTCEELKEIVSKYLTQQSAENFLRNIGKGTMTANPDGTYSVTTDISYPNVLEIDGRLYFELRSYNKPTDLWDTSQVISKTDDTIKFSYLRMDPEYNYYYSRFGLIRYERGSWRLSLSTDGMFDLLL